jgi:hypothetical protein
MALGMTMSLRRTGHGNILQASACFRSAVFRFVTRVVSYAYTKYNTAIICYPLKHVI